MMLWKSLLLVGMGGGIGSIARFLCYRLVPNQHPQAFPWGTLLVNVAGCFLIGVLLACMEKGQLIKPEWRMLLVTGFCGGFTTFSAFAAENVQLLKDGRLLYFLVYTFASVLLGILATVAGMFIFRSH